MADPTATGPNGEKIVFRGGGWQPLDGAAPAAPAPQAGGPPAFIPGVQKAPSQPTPPSEFTRETDERDYDTKIRKQKFDEAKDLRDAFAKRKPVENYQTILRQYAAATGAEDTVVGDQLVINSYATALNPTSTVMPAEYDATEKVDPTVIQIKERLKKEFGWDGAGRVSDEARQWMMNELQGLSVNANKSYNQDREFYSDLARRYGYDPEEVVGPHFGKPFKDDIQAARLEYNMAEAGKQPDFAADGSLNVNVTDESPPVDGNSPGYEQIAAGIGDVVEGGINNTIGLVANPINTVIGRGLGYDKYTADLGQSARDALGLPEGNQLIGSIIQGASGIGAMGGIARGALGAVKSPIARNALTTLADNPLSNMFAGGTAAGASEAARQGGYSPTVQAGAALVGGMAGYGAGRAVNALASPRIANPVMQAADDLNITMMPADAGGAGTRLASGVVRRTLGEIPMAEGAKESLRTGANARDRVASGMGRVSDETGAGQAAQRGAKGFIAKSETRGGELYDRISVPPKAAAETSNTKTALTELTRGLESNPKLSKLWTENPRLKATLEALEKGGLSWEDLKRLRSIVGDIAGSPSLASDGNTNKAMKAFYGALSKDMEATAAATSPRALTEFKRANQYWRGREKRIETVLSSILGNDLNKGEAAAFEQINRWSQQKGGDFKRLAQAIRSMGPDEANEVRATLLGRMGTASKGKQNADGNEFSPAEFMTQWNGLGSRAKAMLFPDADHRKDIDKLVTVMDGMKRAGEYANTSMTSLGTNAIATAGAAYVNPFLGALYAGLQFGAGKLLASPKFARWVASVPANPNPNVQRNLAGALNAVAAKDPTIRAEVIQLSDYLKRSVEASPGRVAASTEEEQN